MLILIFADMRRCIVTIVIILAYLGAFPQAPAAQQQKTMNSYVDYANQSADEVTAIVKSIIEYYPGLVQKNNSRTPRFVCPVQSDSYFFNTAVGESKNLPATYFPIL